MPFTYSLIPTIESIIRGIFVIAGFCLIAKYIWMIYYELKYYPDAGMDYIRYGKKYVKNKLSNGNKPFQWKKP